MPGTRKWKDQNNLGDLRPNQIITTYGPGAIVDALKDSVVVLDIDYWPPRGKPVSDERLAASLNVNGFYAPPTWGNGDIPVASFPCWHVCRKCHRLFKADPASNLALYLQRGATCPDCGASAYPARLIVICENGHMDDFPWHWWVHRGKADCHGKLRVYSRGESSTLADLHVRCEECEADRSLGGASFRENLRGFPCPGHHPHRPEAQNGRCGKPVIAVQRGASNVYFSVTRSAISIPTHANPLDARVAQNLPFIRDAIELADGDERAALDKAYAKRFGDCDRAEFYEAARRCLHGEDDTGLGIKSLEYAAITHHSDGQYMADQRQFCAEEEPVSADLQAYISRIIRVTRLREINVLLGFTRLDAPDPDAYVEDKVKLVRLSKKPGWLPAAETNGEGVFLELNPAALRQWLGTKSVAIISRQYAQGYAAYCRSRGWDVTVARDAKYVLLHTFAHLLIRQMGAVSGYSATAIRERVYCGEAMSGVLLYTGSSDKEGSLGGLVGLGSVGSVRSLLAEAFRAALACTNDPECLMRRPSTGEVNGAACYACCMVAEPACENGNRLLDRGLVVPLAGREGEAYFRDLACELCGLG